MRPNKLLICEEDVPEQDQESFNNDWETKKKTTQPKGIYRKSTFNSIFLLRMALIFGAGYGIRTHDLQLGNMKVIRLITYL